MYLATLFNQRIPPFTLQKSSDFAISSQDNWNSLTFVKPVNLELRQLRHTLVISLLLRLFHSRLYFVRVLGTVTLSTAPSGYFTFAAHSLSVFTFAEHSLLKSFTFAELSFTKPLPLSQRLV